MLKREIKFEDFNGNEVSDVFYFNISKPELIELEVEYDKGFARVLEEIIETKNNKELIKKFKDLVLMAYGEKSEDGKYFLKSDEIRQKFANSAAYQTLFMELATDDNAATVFLKGVLPKDIVAATDQDKPIRLPVPPTPPSS